MMCNHCGIQTNEPIGSPCELCPEGLIEDDDIGQTIRYGFCIEKYSETSEVETLITGDGKTEFVNIDFGNGVASIGIAYGHGKGIGVKYNNELGGDVRWQIKFEDQQSVDAMIETLLHVKNDMARTK